MLCMAQVDSSTLALHLWPPQPLEGVPEPPTAAAALLAAAQLCSPSLAATPVPAKLSNGSTPIGPPNAKDESGPRKGQTPKMKVCLNGCTLAACCKTIISKDGPS